MFKAMLHHLALLLCFGAVSCGRPAASLGSSASEDPWAPLKSLLAGLDGVHVLTSPQGQTQERTMLAVNFTRSAAYFEHKGTKSWNFVVTWPERMVASDVVPALQLVPADTDHDFPKTCGAFQLTITPSQPLRDQKIFFRIQRLRSGPMIAAVRRMDYRCDWMTAAEGYYRFEKRVGNQGAQSVAVDVPRPTDGPPEVCQGSPQLQQIWKRCAPVASSPEPRRRQAALQCLGITNSTLVEARQARRNLLKITHPDVNPRDLECAQITTKLIGTAFELIQPH